MKKLIFTLILVAVYGLTISNVSAKSLKVETLQLSVVVMCDNFSFPQDPPNKKEIEKSACCKHKTTKSCCTDNTKKECEKLEKKCSDSRKKCDAKDLKKEDGNK